MKRILVTGGAGYVGSVLVRYLLTSGRYSVTCLDNLRFGAESLLGLEKDPNFRLANCDLTSFDAVDAVLKSEQFDGIVHLAAIVGDPACKNEPELATKINFDASVHLLQAAMEQRIRRFVFASTCSNYGKMQGNGEYVDEESPLAPVSLYAELKVKVERFILTEMPKVDWFAPTCLRFSTVYGISPRMRFDLTVNEFTKDVAKGRELVVFGEQFWRPYCHVQDFARAIDTVLCAPREKVAYNVFNVGDTNENYTKRMLVDELVRQAPETKVRYVHRNEDPRDYKVDFAKIKSTLGFGISRRVPDGISEIIGLVKSGSIPDTEDQRYYNIPHQA